MLLPADHERPQTSRQTVTNKKLYTVPVVAFMAGVALLYCIGTVSLPSVPAMILGSDENNLPSHHKKKKENKPQPHYYDHQTVDHFNKHDSRTFSNRYFVDDVFFEGPGHPIFVVLGGEDALDGLLYPFVFRHLAQTFGAITLGIEHRFYGSSHPLRHPNNQELRSLMTPQQAIEDVIQLIQWKRQKLGCSLHGTSKNYCPVITVGGSYPGFMSAALRIKYPDVIDIGYAASAPMLLYSHTAPKDAYFDKVTAVSDEAVPGCAAATRTALYELHDYLSNDKMEKSVKEYAEELGICHKSVPMYILDSEESVAVLLREINAVIAGHFAEANMDYYPPRNDTELAQACHIFIDPNDDFKGKISKFLNMRQDWWDLGCFDMHSELPSGKNATISSTDWSGMGDGETATMWEVLTCQLLPQCSISNRSMFFPREWTYAFVQERCESRFGMTPDLNRLASDLRFDDLTNVTQLLFTNGMRDGWEVASVTQSSNDGGVVAINMANGAHHSDLMHGPSEDTMDVIEAHRQIEELIARWLKQSDGTKSGSYHHNTGRSE
jgi:hypothetical protein